MAGLGAYPGPLHQMAAVLRAPGPMSPRVTTPGDAMETVTHPQPVAMDTTDNTEQPEDLSRGAVSLSGGQEDTKDMTVEESCEADRNDRKSTPMNGLPSSPTAESPSSVVVSPNIARGQ